MHQSYVDLLVSLEPVVVEAGKLALELRGRGSRTKSATGVGEVDVVTEADLLVQEKILGEMAKTPLRECLLLAEEKTPSTSLFLARNGLTLTLDPVDGTESYASGGEYFSVIIGLHDASGIYYTLYHYPALLWSRRISNGVVTDSGERPVLPLTTEVDLGKTVVYTYGDPENTAPELFSELTRLGFSFRQRKLFSKDAGSATVFFLSDVAGYFIGNPIAYDGLGVLHFGQTAGLHVDSSVDLSRLEQGRTGPYRPGFYLVRKK